MYQDSLEREIVTNAVSASTRDPRFPPMSVRELDNVTISVDALNRLTLQVVDDPDGAAQAFLLVDQQPLPSAANGKVGIKHEAMSTGAAVRLFNVMLDERRKFAAAILAVD